MESLVAKFPNGYQADKNVVQLLRDLPNTASAHVVWVASSVRCIVTGVS